MAIVTAHTIYIAVLPDPSHLNTEDTSPLKLKTFQLGPTAHVLEQSSIASVIWHPLGYRGRCLVTVTKDAVVRLWELNRADRSTFSEPTLAVDLKKLANATSADENLSASKYGASKGFSPDSFELEVAAACFGGSLNQEGIHGWAPMTLWVAMKEGDVYALCPLLPSKWQLKRTSSTSTFMQFLMASIHSKYASIQENHTASPDDRRTSRQQLSWLSDITCQEPLVECEFFEEIIEVYSRPASTPSIPKLQGPFTLAPDFGGDFELTDIIISGLKTLDENKGGDGKDGIPVSVVCLLTSNCDIHICLDLEGVEGQWLPSGKSQHFLPIDDPEHNLIVFETVHILPNGADGKLELSHPTITADIHSGYSFFVTHERGIFYISMSSWIQKLEQELSTAQNEGAEFRLNLFLDDARSLVEHTIRVSKERYEKSSIDIASCVIIDDSDIGYFLLTTVNGEPCAAALDVSIDDVFLDDPVVERHMSLDMGDLPQRLELRQSYQPPQAFWMRSELASFIEHRVPARRRGSLKEEVKLSPATLELLMNSHRILSQETHQLGLAAADLFRRCERLKEEFRDQIFRASQLATRIDGVTGDDEDDFDADEERIVGSAKIEKRLEEVKLKQHNLISQHERIRKKLAKVGARELTEKEEAWVVELDKMDHSIDGNQTDGVNRENGEVPTWQRFDEVKRLKNDLMMQANKAGADTEDEDANGIVRVPSEFRKQRVGRVMELLERETALVDAATQRLNRLNIQAS
ncbi:hypothetical protein AOQ84DRAFT_364084 [Glonium stellatum]|uniref:Uncharacterized protein n=1 Tax=Glonium stellatum TaxID=574774 RepID=A0A8E2F100_9PEZI|nr:hypothetical protein AOQ84DRAFT_364084 [Glonium stellatum]